MTEHSAASATGSAEGSSSGGALGSAGGSDFGSAGGATGGCGGRREAGGAAGGSTGEVGGAAGGSTGEVGGAAGGSTGEVGGSAGEVGGAAGEVGGAAGEVGGAAGPATAGSVGEMGVSTGGSTGEVGGAAGGPATGLSAERDRAGRPLWARRHPLEADDAARRTTAYVYGNVLVLAGLVVATTADVSAGRAFWVVIGTAASTFVAHVFAELMGDQVRSPEEVTWRKIRELARESLPVLTSGLIPAAILLLSAYGLIAPTAAVLIAEGLVLLRIAATGVVVARLRDERSSVRMLGLGIGVALVGVAVSLLKVYLTH